MGGSTTAFHGPDALRFPLSSTHVADRLDRYRAKRTAGRTPEPFGTRQPGDAGVRPVGHLFVFHKHHARTLHWDLRLELDGALESWAVPKGPSPNPADKRLAMHVEPHPLDYAEFEGVIPEGEYGAGPSIVWDKGIWLPREDPHEGLEKGKLLFELRGYKVRGVWTLVHTPKAGENHWLLIKETGDGYVDPDGGTGDYPDDSIYSGLEVDELPRARAKARKLAEGAGAAGARPVREGGDEPSGPEHADEGTPRPVLRPSDVEVMKATRRDEPFDDPEWVFELKYDGYRIVAGRHEGEATLLSRNGNDLTATFPDVARAVCGLPADGLVLDGEVVVHDEAGLPSFDRLQKRGRLRNRHDIARATLELPAVYYAFDLLGLEGLDLRMLPLTERKRFLRELLPSVGPVRFSEHIPGRGEAVYDRVTDMGLEGIVGKQAHSPYTAGRSERWVKVRAVQTDDFVVVGWTEPKGSRSGFGALHLARWSDDDTLVYRGSVGTGFSDPQLDEIHDRLAQREVDDPPLEGTPTGARHHWIRPELVAEVAYKEITGAGVLRHPSFQRLRDDKPVEECRDGEGGHTLPEPPPVEEPPPEKAVHFTNLDKVFWPATDSSPAYTKGDLIRYYEAVSPWLLPYLDDRPLVLTRYPDGIHGKSFYQKDAPKWAPEWIRTVSVWSDSSERELDYFVADDTETLLYLANLGTIPLHVWHSRTDSLAHPDWCLLDLDPKDAPFSHVVEVALFLHELLGDIALPHFVKTSGSTGLHVLVRLGGSVTYEQSRMLGQLLAHIAALELGEIATVERTIRKREGKVYVDFLQNRHGQLMAAPFAARPTERGTVSAPLAWSEVHDGLDLRDYTLDTVPQRMRALEGDAPHGESGDPMRPVLDAEPPALLEALQALLEREGSAD